MTKAEIAPATRRAQLSMIAIALPFVAILRGAEIIVSGGQENWEGRSLELLMTAFSGAPVLWGAILFSAGVVLLAGVLADHPKMVWGGAWVCAMWGGIAAAAGFVSAVLDGAVLDLGATVVWGFIALCYVLAAQARVARS